MKELIIIIRPKMYFPTKDALDKAGFTSMTMHDVIGRGKAPVRYDNDTREKINHSLMGKKIINMYVKEEDVDQVVDAVLSVNKTGNAGDGKIFILPVGDVVRVRTEEKGKDALV